MAVLWMEGFGVYGEDETNMVDGVWASVAGVLSTTHARTGTYALRNGANSDTNQNRRILGAAKTTCGTGFALWVDALPADNNQFGLIVFCDTGNLPQLYIVLQSTGKLSAYRGDAINNVAALLGETADGVIVAGAFQHVECKATFNNSTGAVELRVNGVTRLSLTGVDTVASANSECSQIRYVNGIGGSGSTGLPGGVFSYIDDVFAWDTSGAQNTDFQGDRRVRTFFPAADTAAADWSLFGAANGYACIDEVTPDEDTTYIEAAPLVGSPPTELVSEFGMEDPPATIGAISAVQTIVRARKTEAGDCSIQVSALSGSSASDGTERAITEQYTYWSDIHELNPDTGTPWNESTLTSAKLRITRTL